MLLKTEIANDHRIRVYEARNGLVWTVGGGSVRTITEAEAVLPAMVDLAVTERSDELTEQWLNRLADLILAIRAARKQAKLADAKDLLVAA